MGRVRVLAVGVWIVAAASAWGFDLDEPIPQRLDRSWLAGLLKRPGELRPVAMTVDGERVPLVLEARFLVEAPTLEIRGKLPRRLASLVTEAVGSLPRLPCRGLRRDGSVLYERGWCHEGGLEPAGAPRILVRWVPYPSRGEGEAPFLCDRGQLRIEIPAFWLLAEGDTERQWAALLGAVLDPSRTRPAPAWAERRHRLLADDEFGPVSRYLGPGPLDEPPVPLPPTHKVTLNKGLADPVAREAADRELCLRLLGRSAPLLSQDERVRLGLVPEGVLLRPEAVERSDIGSGQNTFVFLTLGPGIDYFDAPWQSDSLGSDAPRFVVDPSVLFLEGVQLYPTWSIAAEGEGVRRFGDIGAWQTLDGPDPSAAEEDEPRTMPLKRRVAIFQATTELLLSHGLLAGGGDEVVLRGRRFRGSVVDNEVRVPGALTPAWWASHLIVPPGTGAAYLRAYRGRWATTGLVPARPGGMAPEDFFVEAPWSGDEGMRAAYLLLVLRVARPSLARLVDLGRGRPGLRLLLRACARMAGREGLAFFADDEAREGAAVDRERRAAWVEFVARQREGAPRPLREEARGRFEASYDRWRRFTGRGAGSSVASP